jgi:hypothetical protein
LVLVADTVVLVAAVFTQAGGEPTRVGIIAE